ncbi:AMP-binding protein [Dialister succinatiphilus]|uniref:AMP-binding protein n=1 Tax=Dialister succinatiphilus TaxID=487173 RepID=UPI004029EA53
MKCYEYLLRWGKEKKDALFYEEDGLSMTWGEALRFVEEEKEALSALGVKGKVTALYLHQPLKQLLYFLALSYAGSVPVLYHEYLEEKDLSVMLEKQPVGLFLSDRPLPSLSLKQGKHLFSRTWNRKAPRHGVFGVLTSGSTGLPKILYRRDESWTDFFPLQDRIFKVDGSSRLFFHGSLAFTGNLNMVMDFLSEGASLHGSSRLTPKTWMERIQKEKITHIYMIPSKLSPLSKTRGQAETVTHILTGSQLMTASLYRRLTERFPAASVILYYGASELSYISFTEGKEILRSPDKVGKSFPHVKVSIENGEITVDTPYGIEGISMPYTCHDLGRLDEKGELHFLGRREDMYHVQGNHVSRQKVLSTLLMMEGVEDAEVTALKQTNGDDTLIAFLTGQVMERKQLVKDLSCHLKPWEIPSRFMVLPAIPRTSTGKADRKKLEELAGKPEG